MSEFHLYDIANLKTKDFENVDEIISTFNELSFNDTLELLYYLDSKHYIKKNKRFTNYHHNFLPTVNIILENWLNNIDDAQLQLIHRSYLDSKINLSEYLYKSIKYLSSN